MGQREEQLAAVAEAHYQWSLANENRVNFDPANNNGSEDYSVEYLDLEASPELQGVFVNALGDQTLTALQAPVGEMGQETAETNGD